MGNLSVFEATRLNLSRLSAQGQQDLLRGFVQAAQASAQALQVARVGIWFFSPDARSLVCACLCGPEGLLEVEKTRLALAGMPRYLRALLSRRVVMMNDACNSPETSELEEGYLKPLGITKPGKPPPLAVDSQRLCRPGVLLHKVTVSSARPPWPRERRPSCVSGRLFRMFDGTAGTTSCSSRSIATG